MITNADITVYNFYNFAGETVYSRVVIKGVHWFGRTKTAPSADGLISSSEYTVRVPISANFDKEYVDPLTFAIADKMKFFTFMVGDICVRGESFLINPTKEKLIEQFNDVITLVGITDNRVGNANMRHWRLTGK
jgi:hypothetical protein